MSSRCDGERDGEFEDDGDLDFEEEVICLDYLDEVVHNFVYSV